MLRGNTVYRFSVVTFYSDGVVPEAQYGSFHQGEEEGGCRSGSHVDKITADCSITGSS